MLVPLSWPQVPWFGGSDDRIESPGAVTSGFSCSETGVGPADEKLGDLPVDGRRGDGDRPRRVPGRVDRAVAELVEVVAGGHDRDDARRRPPR